MRQLISTEMQRELLRRAHGGSPSSSGLAPSGGSTAPHKARPPHVPKGLQPKPLLLTSETVPMLSVSRDMFGRPVAKKECLKRPAASSPIGAAQRPYRFKFHEGVTDAVRRGVRVRDLL